jgi:hypothetical protein
MSWFGPKRCNCTCNVDPCECYPSDSGCTAPTAPSLTVSNVPDSVIRSITRTFSPCDGRPCDAASTLMASGYIEITGLSQLNGTYPASTYIREVDGYYSRTFTEESYDPDVCKWWGFEKVTFTLDYSWNWTSAFAPGSVTLDELECASGAELGDSGSGEIDVVFDPVMGTVYTRDKDGTPSVEQYILSLIFKGPNIAVTHDPNTQSPAEPMTFTRNVTTFTCAQSGSPAPAWFDDTDTYTRSWNSPFKHTFDGRPAVGIGGLPPTNGSWRSEGLGALYSPRAPLKPVGGLYRLMPATPGTLPMGVSQLEVGGDYFGYAVETDEAVYVMQSFCYLLTESSDISVSFGEATSGNISGTNCEVYTY